MKTQPLKKFKTSDLSFAGFLLCKGFYLDSITDSNQDSQIKSFVFYIPTNEFSAEELEKEFTAGKALVEPKSYYQNLRAIRRKLTQWDHQGYLARPLKHEN